MRRAGASGVKGAHAGSLAGDGFGDDAAIGSPVTFMRQGKMCALRRQQNAGARIIQRYTCCLENLAGRSGTGMVMQTAERVQLAHECVSPSGQNSDGLAMEDV